MHYFSFVRSNIRPLAFGALHAFYSTPGQTFCIGLFVAAFSADLGISASAIGALYLAGTLSAAVTLLFVGHLIDRIRLVHFSAAVIVGLARRLLRHGGGGEPGRPCSSPSFSCASPGRA